jgi:hypothetical protein
LGDCNGRHPRLRIEGPERPCGFESRPKHQTNAGVAQLEEAAASNPEGCEFESRRRYVLWACPVDPEPGLLNQAAGFDSPAGHT